jgi:hypothetical protein
LFVTLGYKIYGDPAGLDFRNVGFSGVGFSHRVSQPVSAGLSWDYRPKITSTGNPINELTAFISYTFTPVTKLQVYALSGLSDGSPDWGGGVTLAIRINIDSTIRCSSSWINALARLRYTIHLAFGMELAHEVLFLTAGC